MTKRFVVSTDPMTASQEKALKEFFAGPKAGWWHWLPNFWLVKDTSDTLTVVGISDAIAEIAPNVRAMVMEVEDNTWAGRMRPDKKGREMEDWLNRVWPIS